MNIQSNGIPLINGVEYGWADIVFAINGVPVTGITAISYSDKQDMTNIYGAGRYPVARGKGRITPSAKITLLGSEVLAIQSQSINHRIQDIAPFDITVTYLPDSGIIHTDKIRNCQFVENKRDVKEGDMSIPVDLELIVSHIDWGGTK